MPDGDDLEPLFRTIIETIPAPSYDPEAPLQAHVTNLDASNFLGRLALLRVHNGTIRKGQQVAWCRRDGTVEHGQDHRAADDRRRSSARPAESAGPGDIIAVAGIPEITIGETLADPDDPRPLPLITVDEPAISMTIGINTSPMAGRVKGAKVTARLVKDRLDRELVGNVSMRVLPTERPDAWEVQGRGELALAILVEQMRREGYELTVGKPRRRHPRGRRQGARADRARHHRRPRGVPRPDHPAARRPQGPHGADDQPRHRLGAHGVPRALARPDRLPHPVPHRHPRHRHRQPRLRGLRAVGGRHLDPDQRLARRRPLRCGHRLRDGQPAGARLDVHRRRPPRSTRA